MSLEIKRFVNSPINSNCFALYQKDRTTCLIIDPGTKDNVELLDFLFNMKLIPEIVILTHEHYDHIWGVNQLREIFGCKVMCSSGCNDKIINKKKNMSVFYDQIGFETARADILIEAINYTYFWNGINFGFLKTPGHTDCSISIVVENNIFVGDLIVDGHKTVTKLPSGSKIDTINSINTLLKNFSSSSTLVYPGHGNNFMMNEVDINNII